MFTMCLQTKTNKKSSNLHFSDIFAQYIWKTILFYNKNKPKAIDKHKNMVITTVFTNTTVYFGFLF